MPESALERLAKRLERRREDAQSKPRYTLLLVDDEPRNLEALERLLSERYKVQSFTNPLEALTAVRTGQAVPDLILSDQRMPEMNGVEFLEQAANFLPKCMRLVLSGFTEKSDLIAAINHGHVYQYLTKPWTGDDVLVAVEKALELYQLRFEQDLMAQRLQVSNEKLEQVNKELKQLVEQRTSALTDVNQELRRLNQALCDVATVDPLTNLINHRSADEYITRELRRTVRYLHPLSIALADIDHFRRFNEINGQGSGDKVLKRMGEIFRSHIEEPDVVARYGGEEFLFVLPHTGALEAFGLVDRIRHEIANYPFPSSDRQMPWQITVSIGVVTLHPRERQPDLASLTGSELISRADRALAQSKQGGRNRVTAFSPKMGQA